MKAISEQKMSGDTGTRRKVLFFLAVSAAFVLIFVFNVLTPMMTDDLFYAKTVSEASSIGELFAQ